jgi:hypothetical protein
MVKTLHLDVRPHREGCRLDKLDHPQQYKRVMCELFRLEFVGVRTSLVRVEADGIIFTLPDINEHLEDDMEYTMEWNIHA